MTLHQLRLFLAVSKHLNVTQASQELHISQPAASRQLRQLEDACGGKLYTVGPRGIELTANGRLLSSGAEQILSQVERVKSALNGERNSRVLRVGECESLVLSSLPLLWVTFRRLYPTTQVTIRTDSSRAIEQTVLNAEIEVAAVTGRWFHPLLSYENFRREKLVFFAPVKHPLAKKKGIRSFDLSGVPLVIKRTAAKEDLTPDPILGKLAQKGIKLNVAMCCDSGWGVKAAVKEGIGVGLICREAVVPDDRRGDLKIIKVSDLNMEIESYIVFHRERPLSSPAQSLLAFLRQWQQKTDFGVKRLSLA